MSRISAIPEEMSRIEFLMARLLTTALDIADDADLCRCRNVGEDVHQHVRTMRNVMELSLSEAENFLTYVRSCVATTPPALRCDATKAFNRSVLSYKQAKRLIAFSYHDCP